MTTIDRVREFAVNHIAVGGRLEFKQVAGFPKHYVSNVGHVISTKTPELRCLKYYIDLDGYKRATIRNADGRLIKKSVHRIVLESFVGPPPRGMQARHLNGIPHDARIDNLVWCTAHENAADKIRHGTHQVGIKGPSAKLTEDQVRDIRSSVESGRSIARRFQVHSATIYAIRSGRNWKHLK